MFQKNPGSPRTTEIVNNEIEAHVAAILTLTEELMVLSDSEKVSSKNEIDRLINEARSHEMNLEIIRQRCANAHDLSHRLTPRPGEDN